MRRRQEVLGTQPPEERLDLLFNLVDRANDCSLETWHNLAALVHEHHPSHVLELGRGYGNSTAIFTEMANRMGFSVTSVGYDTERAWKKVTAPKLRRCVGRRWFRPLSVVQADITATNFAPLLRRESRPLVFWDAHGTDVAATVLDLILPVLASGSLVVVHDVFDTREEMEALAMPFKSGPYASEYEEIVLLAEYVAAHEIEAHTTRQGLFHFNL